MDSVPNTPPGQLRRMAAVWEQVLKKGGIGPDDSFFTLGGQSVMAGTLVRAAGERFGVRIPIRSLFEYSRLGEFTDHVVGLALPTRRPPRRRRTLSPRALSPRALSPRALSPRTSPWR